MVAVAFCRLALEVTGVEVGRWGATWLTDKEGNLGLSVRVLSGDLGDTRRRHWAYVTVARQHSVPEQFNERVLPRSWTGPSGRDIGRGKQSQ